MINLDMLVQRGIIRYDRDMSIESIRRMLKKFASSADVNIDIYSYFKGIHEVFNIPDYCTSIGIDEPFYNKLNNKCLMLLHNAKDNCKVESSVNLRLPYKYKSPLIGCKYETYKDHEGGKRTFIYWLPKKYVYKQNLCALAISKGIKPKKYHYLVKLLCIDGDYIYLYLVTFSKRVEYSKKIISVSQSLREGQENILQVINNFDNSGVILSTVDYVEMEEGEPFYKFSQHSLESEASEVSGDVMYWV